MKNMHLGQIAVSLTNARSWLERIGVSTKGTRVEELCDYVLNRLLRDDSPEARDLADGRIRRETYVALSDSAALGLVAEQLARVKSHLLERRTIARAISGPMLMSEEVTSTSDGRNVFVELELAAQLSTAGFHPAGFDDLQVYWQNTLYRFECKRPNSPNGFASKLDGAYAQLSRKLSAQSNRGIVAVCMDYVLGLERAMPHFATPDNAGAYSESLINRFQKKVSQCYFHWVDPRVVGVLGIIRFVATMGSPPQVIVSYQIALGKVASAAHGQAGDELALDRMIARIQNSFRS